ncbi:methyltransferase regulatory domain-containing protein [Halomonas sp. LS-001]
MTQELVSQLQQSYNSVPYDSRPFQQSAPEHLHALACLFGLDAPEPAKARVLEIGCSEGGNILPFAARYPDAEVVGIDLSDVQITAGQARLKEAGLTNMRLQAANIEDISKDAKPYDYIICHGVFSWVPASVQQAILRVCSENLSDNGIAYISYNTYPGWKTKEIIRDAMLLRGAERTTPEEKLSYAVGMVDFLQQVSPEGSVMRQVLNENADMIRQGKPSYLLHEFLEPCNQPLYFKDLLAMAGEHGLGYLAEAEPNSMFLSNYAPSIAKPLSKEVKNQEQLEQYLDFVHNRAFRQTLLVRKPNQAKIRYAVGAEQLKKLHVAGLFFEQNIDHQINQTKVYTDWRGGNLTPVNALEYAFMEAISKAYPATLNVSQLAAALKESGQLSAGEDAEAVALALLEIYVIRGHVRLRADDQTAMTKLAKTSAIAANLDAENQQWQWQASAVRHSSGWVATPWHEALPLGPLALVLAETLDTPCRFADLYQRGLEAIKEGEITLMEKGQPVNTAADAEETAQRLKEVLVSMLNNLYRAGVLEMVNAD